LEGEAEVEAEAAAASSPIVKVRGAAPALRIVSAAVVLWPCARVMAMLVGVTVMFGAPGGVVDVGVRVGVAVGVHV
jgi:hypothetical protein